MLEITEISATGDYFKFTSDQIYTKTRISGKAKSDKPFTLGARINMGTCRAPRKYTIRGRAEVVDTYREQEPARISIPGPHGTAMDIDNPLYGLDYGCEFDATNPSGVTVTANA